MNKDMKLYYDYTISPLGKLFYRTLWSQLENITDKKIFDFGSGFGFTSNFLAKNNEVIALEIDKTMIEYSENKEGFTQINGDLSYLKNTADETFDVVTCHLVLEFVPNAKEILAELVRVLKKGGILSIVRHNKNGRIIQAIVQDYDLDDAKKLLSGGFSYSSAFGDIKYYSNDDLLSLLDNKFVIKSIHGIRGVASLHNSQTQNSENWVEKMLEIEKEICDNPDFINVAYFNHILLEK